MGGLGSIVVAVAVGQLGQPRLRVTAMYAAWAFGILLIGAFGLMTELWHALLISALCAALFELGQIIWTTMIQQLVPNELLGQVSSLDWLVSIGLVPLSFALVGPVVGLIGPEETLIFGGILGAILTAALLFVPGVQDPERRMRRPAPVAGDESSWASGLLDRDSLTRASLAKNWSADLVFVPGLHGG